jgi:tartrate/fumarate subfamily iron-sulfur-dependent hydro-lyase alpha chain
LLEYDVLKECAAALYLRALGVLPPDVLARLQEARDMEEDPGAAAILGSMLENSALAAESSQLICQDTGFPVFLVEVGAGCQFSCDPAEALSAGIAQATVDHSLRANCVDPITRANTGTNRGRGYPIVHCMFAGEDPVARITLLAKGSGSESRSRLAMLDPVGGLEAVREFVLETVAMGSPYSCPPVVVGVGLGGSFDSVALLSKRALARPLGRPSEMPELAALEEELLGDINSLGIGPMGLGGGSTALWVSVEAADTHITCNPVSVNMSCWAHRRATATVTPDGYQIEEGE